MLQQEVDRLFDRQQANWPALRDSYTKLGQTEKKTLHFPSCRMEAIFNPDRMRSTAAKTDARSIRERPCFLCQPNRPVEQEGIDYKGEYTIIVNPFPIFSRHFTIPANLHTPQRIEEKRLEDMLSLAQELPRYTIFYNGPAAGASAPDHFHFQAGERKVMPVEDEINRDTEILFESDGICIKNRKNYIRHLFIIEGTQKEKVITAILQVLDCLGRTIPLTPEPMVNLMAFYQNGQWTVCLFPRKKHRPAQFFEEGESQFIFSPGTVDMGGMLILPREKDFRKITEELTENMFKQLIFNTQEFDNVKSLIRNIG